MKNADQVVLVCCKGERMIVGEAMKKIEMIKRNEHCGVSIVVDW